MKKKYEFDGEFKFLENSPYTKYWLLISIICTSASVYMVIYGIISKIAMRWYAILGFAIISDICIYLYFSTILRYLNKLSTISTTTDSPNLVKLHLLELTKNGDWMFAGMASVVFNAIAQFITCITYNQGYDLALIIIACIFCLLYNFCKIIRCSKMVFNMYQCSKSITKAANRRIKKYF